MASAAGESRARIRLTRLIRHNKNFAPDLCPRVPFLRRHSPPISCYNPRFGRKRAATDADCVGGNTLCPRAPYRFQSGIRRLITRAFCKIGTSQSLSSVPARARSQ